MADGIALLLQALTLKLMVERYATAGSLLAAAPDWLEMDLVLLDLGLPDADGLSTLKKLRSLRDDVPVVVISGSTDRPTVLQAIDLGAMGFVPKTSSTSVMIEALRTVLEGGVYLPPPDGGPRTPVAEIPRLHLTPKQWQILRCILQGKPIKRIATTMNIAECTVKTHITPILRELGVTTRTEAIVRASAMNLRFPQERL